MYDRDDWLAKHREDIIEPERSIIDPHHHLWNWSSMSPYLTEQLWADTDDGHSILKTVYIECGWAYDKSAPEHLKSVGETVFVANTAAKMAEEPSKAQIAGIVSRADPRHPEFEAALDAHRAAGNGLFRGIRFIGALDDEAALSIPGHADEGLYQDPEFRRGLNLLGKHGLSFEAWQYHHQLPEVTALARACPETTIILDHFSTPIGVGRYANQREDIFERWKAKLAELAECENVCAKLGGLAMIDNGWGYEKRGAPISSDELIADQARYYHIAIEQFGPERCMFESNFPVDRASVSYHVLWNAFKKMASGYSEAEQNALFHGTAQNVYRL